MSDPTLNFEIQIGDTSQEFTVSPDLVYSIASAGIKRELGVDPNASESAKQMSRLTRVTVKGALLAIGPGILDHLFKSKDHPSPRKGDDIIEWYADIFAKVLIANAMHSRLILRADRGDYGQGRPIVIHEVRSESIPEPS